MSGMRNLLPEPPATRLPMDAEASAALESAAPGAEKEVAARFPSYSDAWAALAKTSMDAGEPVAAYAYARTGYHRGLDQLRRAGWRGSGPVPWSHEPLRPREDLDDPLRVGPRRPGGARHATLSARWCVAGESVT